MKVTVPIPVKKVYEMKGPKRVQDILKELGLPYESVIVIYQQDLLTPDAVVPDDAEIEVRPAISGGGA
ncbi:MAG: MoaD/ThiS family protein [Bacillota bacterium]